MLSLMISINQLAWECSYELFGYEKYQGTWPPQSRTDQLSQSPPRIWHLICRKSSHHSFNLSSNFKAKSNHSLSHHNRITITIIPPKPQGGWRCSTLILSTIEEEPLKDVTWLLYNPKTLLAQLISPPRLLITIHPWFATAHFWWGHLHFPNCKRSVLVI